ncbi:phosphoribosylaminoimidazolesuccinocarboxamide synthase [Fodinibius sediminis]|uniref:Phosphoribosylaminoimidazole-succinocarboxamide synthase n=1 Tax=Fodinibius sediminis TaxID=1214077 RepID=A0A521E7Y6_9BACT|nr:phosphoribosylaminoimidazolesuccinocarboxamide synthase [Fodinibius sediminis]SMO79280.1 phosphoribosylaminoimidazole-succinocarboxamide synthase [Fodinibius sediminis]
MDNSPITSEVLDNCIIQTDVPGGAPPYRGKVRDVYALGEDKLGIVASDRISAFDHIMKQAIPYKGQILNKLAAFSFGKVDDLVSTHIIDVPHPNVTIAKKCTPIPIEVVIRACLTGHAARVYQSGKRVLCGVDLPEGMVENQRFEEPILTPATKAEEGHDEDISEQEILEREIVAPDLWEEIRTRAFQIFERGQQIAREQGLILVDTKYEFGLYNGELTLIDEVHTADSSRYFYADEYEQRLKEGKPQKQLSKEFLREWLMDHHFQGKEGQTLPDLPDTLRKKVFERYAELFGKLTGKSFDPTPIQLENLNRELEKIFSAHR